eukprot:TRINITY_DN64443_c0_g1_i1.p1 TRINITY_DN64443_c0_g1~~TRINITY_DN64443_c0_g1_i1.p1  ORF type:complete len:488 (+),score=36.52 TRINITY_DN64443_c0_g1_i1:117-1466(+)
MGSGHALLGTRSDWRAHLREVHETLGIKSVRFHGVFDDDMNVVLDGPRYEFWDIDQVYDYIVSLGMKPIVELSFMPGLLAGCKPWGHGSEECRTVMHYKGITQPPKHWGMWYDLVHTFAAHLVDRYGLAEVQTWHFEVWNELWGMPFPVPYMDLYNTSAHALKAVDKSLKVGGPATEQLKYLPEFFAEAKKWGAPVDFVSSHLYPTDPNCTHTHSSLCWANLINEACSVASKHGVPFLLTEFNAGLQSPLLYSSYSSAFLIANLPHVQCADTLSWWAFSDIFEEGGQRTAPFEGTNYGVQTRRGFKKPSYRGFELLHVSHDKRLSTTQTGEPDTLYSFATRNSTHCRVYISNWALYNQDPPKNISQVTLNISPAPKMGSKVTVYTIDDEHANVYAEWEKLGKPTYPTKDQTTKLTAASMVGQRQLPGGATLNLGKLDKNGVLVVEFSIA